MLFEKLKKNQNMTAESGSLPPIFSKRRRGPNKEGAYPTSLCHIKTEKKKGIIHKTSHFQKYVDTTTRRPPKKETPKKGQTLFGAHSRLAQ